MKKILFAAIVIGLLVPAAAFAAAPAQNPTDFCKANPGLIGAGKLYANFGACVTAQGDKQEANTTNAAKTCKAERASIGVDAFAAKYGTNKNKMNAFGKCVSKLANAKTGAQQTAEVNAAKKCRTAENAAKIGAGKTWRNFGACVKAQSKTS
jgi:hypothetical protein